jgi:hypothetical protein
MMKALCVSLMCFVVLFAACDAREARVNDKEDLANGEKVSTEFLTERKAHNLDKAMELTQIDKDNPQYSQHINNFKSIESAAGGLVEFKLDSARSNIIKEGGESTGEIKLSYTVIYEHGQANEDYYLGYVGDELKIIQYIINM